MVSLQTHWGLAGVGGHPCKGIPGYRCGVERKLDLTKTRVPPTQVPPSKN